MHDQKHHAKVIPYKITYFVKKWQKLSRTISKKNFYNLQEMKQRNNVQKQYQNIIPIQQLETQSIRSEL